MLGFRLSVRERFGDFFSNLLTVTGADAVVVVAAFCTSLHSHVIINLETIVRAL